MRYSKKEREDAPKLEANAGLPATIPPYAALLLTQGEVIIYDTTNHKAWIQSTCAVGLEDAI
ncbi:DUF7331 family protein [Haloarchaeobius sp. TZWSO28]|uniref:DUF7331 family protein n=1 Tax=unclassified Haloarchaeobius TaxID=2614452 RepID=UPI003EBCBB7D